jgi:hypothetical protein
VAHGIQLAVIKILYDKIGLTQKEIVKLVEEGENYDEDEDDDDNTLLNFFLFFRNLISQVTYQAFYIHLQAKHRPTPMSGVGVRTQTTWS